ncbi:MAG: hypothetical protein PVG03_16885, partial [Desulfarculaceae bacterium]
MTKGEIFPPAFLQPLWILGLPGSIRRSFGLGARKGLKGNPGGMDMAKALSSSIVVIGGGVIGLATAYYAAG